MSLAARIDAGELLPTGGAEREIRACAVHACELISQRTGIPPRVLDHAPVEPRPGPRVQGAPAAPLPMRVLLTRSSGRGLPSPCPAATTSFFRFGCFGLTYALTSTLPLVVALLAGHAVRFERVTVSVSRWWRSEQLQHQGGSVTLTVVEAPAAALNEA